MTPAEVQRRLGRPELRALFAAVREALETRGPEQAKTVSVGPLSAEERRAVADLHGWAEIPTDERVKISIAKLDAALRASAVGLGIVEVVVALSGALVDRRSARADAEAARANFWARAREHIAAAGRPEIQRWLDELRGHGLVARAASLSGYSEAVLLDRALAVVARLPAPGTLLAVLATEALGDAHALDAGRVEAGLVLRAAACLAGWAASPTSSAERRQLWAAVGVACDPLSADVLTLGLRPGGDGRLARHLRESSEEGEPHRVTLRELMRGSLAVAPGTEVFVCENPSIVAAAADELASRCAPLVCVEGVPSTAALELLRKLSAAEATFRFRADFDWAGVRIANLVAAQLPNAAPWRMSAADYESAASQAGDLLPLNGPVVAASWDPALAPAMAARCLAVPEERIVAALLGDLHRLHSA